MAEGSKAQLDLLDEKKLVTGVVSKVIDRVLATGESAIRNAWARHRNRTQQGVAAYVQRQLRRHTKIKNFLLRDEPVPLDALFVEPVLTRPGRRHSSEELLQTLYQFNRVLVLAPPGSGKTLLAKKILLESLRKEDGYLPIFVELRQLAQFGYDTILAAMNAAISASLPEFMPEQLASGLEHGLFTLIFDGFDELDREKGRIIQVEILKMSARYPYIRILVTSRPLEMLRAWNDFIVYRIEPHEIESAIRIVEKFPYEREPKDKLVSLFRSGELQRNINVLQNPLMCLVMLPGLKSSGNLIRTVDYFDACIDTLVRVQDATKESFDRSWKAGLGITRLRQCVAALSLITYLENAYSFSHSSLRDYVETARDLVGADFDTDDFIYDITINMALLEEVNLGYEFQYRQFQEYLAACYIVGLEPDKLKQTLSDIAIRQDTDEVLNYSYALNKLAVEQNWSIFILEDLLHEINRLDGHREIYLDVFAQKCVVVFLGRKLVDWSIEVRSQSYPMWAAMRLHGIKGVYELASDALIWAAPNSPAMLDVSEKTRVNRRRREAGYEPMRERPLRREFELIGRNRFGSLVLNVCRDAIRRKAEGDREQIIRIIAEIKTKIGARKNAWWRSGRQENR